MHITEKQAKLLRDLDVLLLDDNRILLGIVSKILNSLGIASLRTASDGTMGLRTLKERPANLVITDLNMRPMNGLTFTRRVRSGEDGIDPRTPVIALTGNSDPDTVKASLLAGMNGFMVKPVNPQAMVMRIEKVVSARVIYQLKGAQYVAAPKATEMTTSDLLYDGILPRVFEAEAKSLENRTNTGQEDEAWVLD